MPDRQADRMCQREIGDQRVCERNALYQRAEQRKREGGRQGDRDGREEQRVGGLGLRGLSPWIGGSIQPEQTCYSLYVTLRRTAPDRRVGQGRAGQGTPGHIRAGLTRAHQGTQDQTKPYQTRQDRTGPDRTTPSHPISYIIDHVSCHKPNNRKHANGHDNT